MSTGVCMSVWGWGWCGCIGWAQMQPSHPGREPVHVNVVWTQLKTQVFQQQPTSLFSLKHLEPYSKPPFC